jgi:hypothetical protein
MLSSSNTLPQFSPVLDLYRGPCDPSTLVNSANPWLLLSSTDVDCMVSKFGRHILQTMECYVHPSAGGLRRRRERQPILRTSCPAMLTQRVRGAGGGSTRVILLQLCLDIRAPMQGIFQYNNVLGSPSQGITTTYRRSFAKLWP